MTGRNPCTDPVVGDEIRRITSAGVIVRRVVRIWVDGNGLENVTYETDEPLPRTCELATWRRWALAAIRTTNRTRRGTL